MSFFEICFYGALGLVLVYLVVRLASAAFFRSKHQFDIQQRK